MSPIHVVSRFQPALTAAALVLALTAPALAQDTVPGAGTATRVPAGPTQLPAKTEPTARPAIPGGQQLILFPGVPQLPSPGGAATKPPAAPLPAPVQPPSLPGGTVIKRLDVPPLITGHTAKTNVTVSPTPDHARIGPNPNGRLIDPALLGAMGTPPSTTPNQFVPAPAADAGIVSYEEPVRAPVREPVELPTPATSDRNSVDNTAAFLTTQDAIVGPPPPATDSSNPITGQPGRTNGSQPPPRPGDKLTFTDKNVAHIWYGTPREGSAAEQASVQEHLGPVSAFIANRKALMAQQQAIQGCAAPAPPVAQKPKPEPPPSLNDWLAGTVIDPHGYCTKSRGVLDPLVGAGGPVRGFEPRPEPRPEPQPEPPSEPKADPQQVTSADVSYWNETVTAASNARAAARERVKSAELQTQIALSEFNRMRSILKDWHPNKADWLIEGETNYIDRLDGANGKKQSGGTIRKAKTATRRKTRVETEQDLLRAIEILEARRLEEKALRQQLEDAERDVERATDRLTRAMNGDPGGKIPDRNGVLLPADQARQE